MELTIAQQDRIMSFNGLDEWCKSTLNNTKLIQHQMKQWKSLSKIKCLLQVIGNFSMIPNINTIQASFKLVGYDRMKLFLSSQMEQSSCLPLVMFDLSYLSMGITSSFIINQLFQGVPAVISAQRRYTHSCSLAIWVFYLDCCQILIPFKIFIINTFF